MIGRGATSGRTDDTADVITRRIEEYKSKTAPVAEYYDLQGKLEVIRGDQGIEETFRSLSRQIDKHLLPVA
jgi:adenylate kinase